MKTIEVYQIEMNKIDGETRHHMYLKADHTITDVPATALEFSTFDECEKVRKEMDYANIFHTQKMIRNKVVAK